MPKVVEYILDEDIPVDGLEEEIMSSSWDLLDIPLDVEEVDDTSIEVSPPSSCSSPSLLDDGYEDDSDIPPNQEEYRSQSDPEPESDVDLVQTQPAPIAQSHPDEGEDGLDVVGYWEGPRPYWELYDPQVTEMDQEDKFVMVHDEVYFAHTSDRYEADRNVFRVLEEFAHLDCSKIGVVRLRSYIKWCLTLAVNAYRSHSDFYYNVGNASVRLVFGRREYYTDVCTHDAHLWDYQVRLTSWDQELMVRIVQVLVKWPGVVEFDCNEEQIDILLVPRGTHVHPAGMIESMLSFQGPACICPPYCPLHIFSNAIL